MTPFSHLTAEELAEEDAAFERIAQRFYEEECRLDPGDDKPWSELDDAERAFYIYPIRAALNYWPDVALAARLRGKAGWVLVRQDELHALESQLGQRCYVCRELIYGAREGYNCAPHAASGGTMMSCHPQCNPYKATSMLAAASAQGGGEKL